jgi:hypothetical protein
MEIVATSKNNQHYYWRNADHHILDFQQSNVPIHGRTLRDSYVIPVGRCVKLDMLDIVMLRTAASSANAEVLTEIELVKPDLTTTCIHRAILFDKLLGAITEHEHDSNIFVNNGATLKLWTTDPSPSGTITFNIKLLFQSFDY